MENFSHIPVLLNEVIAGLGLKAGDNAIDATLGGGGYSLKLLQAVAPKGKVLSLDLDQVAVTNFVTVVLPEKYKKSSVVVHSNFADIDKVVVHKDFNNIKAIVADLGMSSYHIDASGRGISFSKNEPLDMRFDASGNSPDAKFLLNEKKEAELEKIFSDYGEERFAKAIAKAVVEARKVKRFSHTQDLTEVILDALPKSFKHKANDSYRKVFQALRIAVNHELENLENFLPKAFDLLISGGRLAIVSFHSLEDRMVKQYFNSLVDGCVCPPDFPACRCGFVQQGKLINKGGTIAGDQEQQGNPRSHSARLRIIEKI